MNTTAATLVVKSHVARDLLQNAGLFKTDKLVVWEYVSNSLQYVDIGTSPVVRVLLDSKRKRILIADNGRGMDWEALKNFFVMHGENLDRREGRPGRGRFGTGKSAAFGIGDVLRVTTVRSNLRQSVELSRRQIEGMGEGIEIPVRVIEKDVATAEPNGTVIEVDGIYLKALDQQGVIHYVERHLARWPRNCTVFVNNYECSYSDPPTSWDRTFRPEGEILSRIGDVSLIVRVSKVPLEAELRGISIFSNGVWHETTLAGGEGREMSQYIFGEIDVPRLDSDRSPIEPFDLSRSMRLNPSNELVQFIYAFIGRSVEEVRKSLIDAEKNRRATEEAKKLEAQASEIARLINEDFEAFRRRIATVRAKSKGATDKLRTGSAALDENDDLFQGGDIAASESGALGNPGSLGEGDRRGGTEPRTLMPELRRDPEGNRLAQTLNPDGHTKRRSTGGGFSVKFKNMGAESHRAQYSPDERTIYVNLEHPQVVAARGALSVEDIGFRRLAFEVAFSEYAIALASELNARDEYADTGEPIFDIRDTVNRLARRGALLYAG